MAERSIRVAPAAHESDDGKKCEVGHIALGERRFSIILVPTHSHPPRGEEICRFEVNGLRLAVVAGHDTENAHGVADDLAARLTGRELQIAVLVAQGYATKNIAYHLRISEWTVATYLRRVFAKLNVDSRAAMVYRCAPLINATLAPDLRVGDEARRETRGPPFRGHAL
jgi:DNA-binding CsgD family transcriptional regulator